MAWADGTVRYGRIFAVTDNAVSRSLRRLAAVVGRDAVVLADEIALRELRTVPLGAADALVLCDHDAAHRHALLTFGLDAGVGYLAMLGSRSRARTTYEELRASRTEAELARLHVPAGLDLGGGTPGEIALSVLAEVVAVDHGRPGGPMRTPAPPA